MAKRYFSAESAHGSESSYGFSNDTIVLVFDSKTARDNYVSECKNISCKAIPFKSATKYASNYSLTRNMYMSPIPFTPEYWGITNDITDYTDINGCLGEVAVCNDNCYPKGERVYK